MHFSVFVLGSSDKDHPDCKHILVGIGENKIRKIIVTQNLQVKFKDAMYVICPHRLSPRCHCLTHDCLEVDVGAKKFILCTKEGGESPRSYVEEEKLRAHLLGSDFSIVASDYKKQ